jgi:hypothetical protein
MQGKNSPPEAFAFSYISVCNRTRRKAAGVARFGLAAGYGIPLGPNLWLP